MARTAGARVPYHHPETIPSRSQSPAMAVGRLFLRIIVVWALIQFIVWPLAQPSWSNAVARAADGGLGMIEAGGRVTGVAASGRYVHMTSELKPGGEPAASWDCVPLHLNAVLFLSLFAAWPGFSFFRRAGLVLLAAAGVFAIQTLTLLIMVEHVYAVTMARLSASYYSPVERWGWQFLHDTAVIRSIALLPAVGFAFLFITAGITRETRGKHQGSGPRAGWVATAVLGMLVGLGAAEWGHTPRVVARQAEADVTRGWALLDAENAEAADAWFGAALRRSPNLGTAHEGRGRVRQSQGRNAEAAASFRQAVALSPESASSGVSLGNALTRLADLDGALSAYEAVLALQPAHREAALNRAATLRALGRAGEADAALEGLLLQHPDYAPALLALSVSWIATGRGCAAVSHLKRLTGLPLEEKTRRMVSAMLAELLRQCAAGTGTGATPPRP